MSPMKSSHWYSDAAELTKGVTTGRVHPSLLRTYSGGPCIDWDACSGARGLCGATAGRPFLHSREGLWRNQ